MDTDCRRVSAWETLTAEVQRMFALHGEFAPQKSRKKQKCVSAISSFNVTTKKSFALYFIARIKINHAKLSFKYIESS